MNNEERLYEYIYTRNEVRKAMEIFGKEYGKIAKYLKINEQTARNMATGKNEPKYFTTNILDVPKTEIDKIFEEFGEDPEPNYLIAIYKLVFPTWPDIKQVKMWPSCSYELWQHIFNYCKEYDIKFNTKSFKGGLWLNNGFSANDRLAGEIVSVANVSIIYEDRMKCTWDYQCGNCPTDEICERGQECRWLKSVDWEDKPIPREDNNS